MKVQTRSKIGSIALELYLGRYFDKLIIDLRKWSVKIPKFGKKILKRANNGYKKAKHWLSEKFLTTSKVFVPKLITPSDRTRRAKSKTFIARCQKFARCQDFLTQPFKAQLD